jgi:hypothetical protein
MRHKFLTLYLVAFFALPQVAVADILAILIDPNSLPFDLSQNNFANSPGNFANSDGNFANSEGNFANSPGNFANSDGNYANGMNGENRIISEDNQFLGYYVFSDSGVMNLYSANGNRIAYMPSGGHTQSLFFNQGGWCGTIGESNGKTVLGLARNCYFRFTLN